MKTSLLNPVTAVYDRRTVSDMQSATVTDRRYSSFPLRILCVFCALAVASSAFAATTWSGPTWSVSTAIPDNDDVGLTDSRAVSVPGMMGIESVAVTLDLTGGWNGDLYAYLVHGSGFSVLLNRPGRSLASPDGSATVGMDITFDDLAAADIHTAIPMGGGTVGGIYQPDGRASDPLSVLNTDPRTAMLASFNGLDPNGTWTLFVADQSPGETSTLQSWSLTITTVPEPSAALLTLLSATAMLKRRRSVRQSASPPVRQSASPPVNQSTSQPVNQSTSQLIH